MARAAELGALGEHFTMHRSIRPAHHPDRVLALKPLRGVLGGLDRGHPSQHDLRALSHRLSVLDLELMIDHIALRVEPQRLGHPQAEAVFAGQHEIAGWRARPEGQLLGRERESYEPRRLARPGHAQSSRGEEAGRDHGLRPAIVELPRPNLPSETADLCAIQWRFDRRRPIGNARRVLRRHRCREGCAGRGRRCRVLALRGRGDGDFRLLVRLLLRLRSHEDRRIDHQQRGHQQQGQRGPLVHYPLDRLTGGGS